MTYRDSLHPWCIIRHLPNAQTIIVARFRKRNDAESYLKTLKQMTPEAIYSLIFEPPLKDEWEAAIEKPTSLSGSNLKPAQRNCKGAIRGASSI